jgi:hypothetical protein
VSELHRLAGRIISVVTGQTTLAVVVHSLGFGGKAMRIVTGDASERSFTLLETEAVLYLLDLPDEPLGAAVAGVDVDVQILV